jgi:glutamate-1-semialdehyde 2,1-aminomutase
LEEELMPNSNSDSPKQKIVAVVQARMGSSRLPGKVMMDLHGSTVIEVLLKRLSRSALIDEIVVATSIESNNRVLIEHVKTLGFKVFVGSENDVLHRYVGAAEAAEADVVIRITGDCPLIDPDLVDEFIEKFLNSDIDYLSDEDPPTFPDGLDTEVFSIEALKQADRGAVSNFEREHVTPYLRKNASIRRERYCAPSNESSRRWTVDELADLTVVRNVIRHFAPSLDFGWREIMELQNKNSHLFASNQGIVRNEGAVIGAGQKLWKRAKNIIPGGNMLLSKRSEMFLPEQWPSYFSKAKGCEVWDLEGYKYTDMSIMGIGTNTLGYGDEEVDAAVRSVIDNGNMSTLNCPEEVYLAEKLVEIHPWSDMVRFTRSGGEANSVAIRIARAATGKSVIAFCGYHGWHDWYLSANLGDDNHLAGHLLPGLAPNGVPTELSGTAIPFNYNKINELVQILDTNPVAAIMMEVSRSFGPDQGFLEGVRRIATERGVVLIFDECTSGFRETFGGLHKKYGVEPDLAMFGKALGNGYAINAIIGRQSVMESAQSTFISSTFWTERIGPVAGLETLKVMERIESWKTITEIGNSIQSRWKDLGDRHGISLEVAGLPALSNFTIPGDDWPTYKTLITQEMLKRGFLASNSIYVCTHHSPEIVDDYFANLDEVFTIIQKCEDGLNPLTILSGPIAHNGFKRLN